MTEPQEPENSTRRLPTVESAPSGGVLEMDQSASGSSYEPAPAREEPGGRAGRFWSGRRIPAALVALVVLGGCGLLLYDVAAVRADHPAMQWRRTAADDLASRHLDDVWVLAASALAAALGLWLLLLALTPGLRALLPMSPCGTPVYGPGSTGPPPPSSCGTGPWRWPGCSPYG